MKTQIQKQGTKSLVFDKRQLNKKQETNNSLKNKGSLLDISIDNDNQDSILMSKLHKKGNKLQASSNVKFKSNNHTLEQFSPLSSPKSNYLENQSMTPKVQISQAFIQDFKQYLEYRQQKRGLQMSSNDLKNVENVGEQEDNTKQEYNAKVQKHKQQTKKIMIEINKKLKIQGKSKVERFEDQMQVFKNTETYIEIKPFLEQLNKINHQKFIQQIEKYESNIKLAQQYQQQDNFLKNSSLVDSNIYGSTIKRSDEISMRKFEDIISKAYSTIIKSNNFKSYKLLQSNIIQKLMDELGYQDSNNNSTGSDSKEENQSITQQANQPSNTTESNSIKQEQQNPQRKDTVSKLSLKQNQQAEQSQIKSKPNLEIGDLTSDENQFFVNLKDYLNKAQKDINLKIELETELNTYAQVIEDNERKIEEAKQQQVKKFMNGKLDPQNLFEGDRDVELKLYYERFREKAEQVRSTLHKVNQQLFQKKWANAQIKRKMERQRERNQLLLKFKNNKQETTDDLLNPSKKMNQRLLRNRNQQNHIQRDSYDDMSKLRADDSLNKSVENPSNNGSQRSLKNLQFNDDQNIYITAPPVQDTQSIPITLSSINTLSPFRQFKLNAKQIDAIAVDKDNKLKSINEKINNNSINLPLIKSTKNLQFSHILSPNQQKKVEFRQLYSQSTKNLNIINQQYQNTSQQNQLNLFKPQLNGKQTSSQINSNSQTPLLQQQSEKSSANGSHRNSTFDPSLSKKVSVYDQKNQRMSIYAQHNSSNIDEGQQRIEQIIQDIDEERNEYAQEKKNISYQLELIGEHYDKEMSKYSKNDNVDSIRGIQSDIPQHQYHSGLKLFQNKYNKSNR